MIRGTDAMDDTLAPAGGLGGRSRKLVIAGAALVVLVAIAGFGWPVARRWMASEDSVDLARLRVATVTRGDLQRDVAAQGRIVAAHHPRLYSPADGIVSLSVRAGEGVKAGQLLARVASPQLDSALAQERARFAALSSELERRRIANRQRNLTNQQNARLRHVRLDAARRELVRAEKLRGEGLLNQVDHDRAQDAVRVAEVEMEQADSAASLEREALEFELEDAVRQVDAERLAVSELERRVAELVIVAPFDGMVASIEVEDRDAVTPNRPILTVVDLGEFEIEVQVPETYADDVTPGTAAVVIYNGNQLPAKVTAISPEVSGGQVEGTLVFDGEPPAGLRQSQRVSTRLLLERRPNVLKVPRGPFLESGGGRQIFVLEDGLATLRPIETGAVSVGEVEILSGLAEGDQVLLSDIGQFNGAKRVLVRK